MYFGGIFCDLAMLFEWKSLMLPTFFWHSRNRNKLGSYPTNRKQKVETRPFNDPQNFFSN
jgi:hypothetical protein